MRPLFVGRKQGILRTKYAYGLRSVRKCRIISGNLQRNVSTRIINIKLGMVSLIRSIVIFFTFSGGLEAFFLVRTSNLQSSLNSEHRNLAETESTNRLLFLCPSLQIIDAENEIHKLAEQLENTANRHSYPLNLTLKQDRSRLNGLWRTLATSLKMTKIVSFSQLAMANVDKTLNDREVEIENMFQYINFEKEVYDNYVSVKLNATTKDIHFAVVSRGCATSASLSDTSSLLTEPGSVSKRLAVRFSLNEIVPFAHEKVTAESFTKERKLERRSEELRKALQLSNEVPLKFPLNVNGWSDCTYLSDDSTVRIMRGNNNNIYVLQRVR